mgnify:CR=1 FL=1
MEHPQAHYDGRLWNPPSPFVTHEQLAPMHNKIGSLEKGQEHVLNTYAHLRGEMLAGFDRIEQALTAEKNPAEKQSGVSLSMRELVVAAMALVIAGAFLGRIISVDRLMGG